MEFEIQRKLLTPAEVANMLRLDIRTLRALSIPVIRLGRQYRYDERDVCALLVSACAASYSPNQN